MEVTRIFDLLDLIKVRYNKDICLVGKKSGKWVNYSIDQYRTISDEVSYGLLKSGITKGDNIATITNNRPEWNFVDMGIMQTGAVHVPISQNINDDDLIYILNETEVKIIFVANNFLFKKVSALLPKINSLQKIYTFDHVTNSENYQELLNLGKSFNEKNNLESIKKSILSEDVATIIYTSGIPKGVILTHNNIVSNFIAYSKTLNLDYSDTAFSYLPLSHAFERMINYQYQFLGITIYYAQSFAGILSNLKEVKPTVFSSVPLILEKIYINFTEKGNNLNGL
jgi:long-chain acyl-CoA synthetase